MFLTHKLGTYILRLAYICAYDRADSKRAGRARITIKLVLQRWYSKVEKNPFPPLKYEDAKSRAVMFAATFLSVPTTRVLASGWLPLSIY